MAEHYHYVINDKADDVVVLYVEFGALADKIIAKWNTKARGYFVHLFLGKYWYTDSSTKIIFGVKMIFFRGKIILFNSLG